MEIKIVIYLHVHGFMKMLSPTEKYEPMPIDLKRNNMDL